MPTTAKLASLLVGVSERAATAATDSLVSLAAGTPAQLRLSITPGLVTGRSERVRLTVPDLKVAGLRLAVVDVRGQRLRLAPTWPLRLQAERVTVHVRVEQSALDRWTRSNGLPLRIALRPGVVSARTGIAGVRLGEAEIGVHLDRGRLRLTPRRMSMAGVALGAAAMPPVTLPLPTLPRRANLLAVEPADGTIDLTFELTDLDEPLTADRLRWAAGALRRRTDPTVETITRDRPPSPRRSRPIPPAVTGPA